MRRFAFSRRHFVRGLGATALLAPFATRLQLERARAAGPARRALFVYLPDGCIPAKWHPTGSETSFTLPEMTAPLAAVKQHLVFLDGLEMFGPEGTHEGGIYKVLTGHAPESLDVYLGDQIGGSTPYRSLQLGVAANFQSGAPGTVTFVGGNTPVKPDDNPLNAFTRVFGGIATGGDDLAARRKKSVLDAASADLDALKRRLGRDEKEKLDFHVSSLREVEARITGAGIKACDVAGFNSVGFSVSETDYYPKTWEIEDNFRTVGRLQMDLATLALSCGATNVATVQFSHQVSPTKIAETGVPINNHDASHYGEASSATASHFVTLKRWFLGEFVYLIEKLAATPDSAGSLLDNTLVVLCSELGDSNLHDHRRVPFVLAGRAGGALKTGRFLNYAKGGNNEPHNKLLVSIANAVGVDIDRYGRETEGIGPLSGLL